MLRDVVDVLIDPADGSRLSVDATGTHLTSENGASFVIDESGYAVITPAGHDYRGDDAPMVRSRETFLSRGHYAPFVEAVTHSVDDALEDAGVADDDHPVIVEIGAGTGYYIAHALDTVYGSRGIGVDVSRPAAERLAEAHPRIGAVVADAWSTLPIADASVDVIIVAFAPANAAEFARILKPGGQLVMLSDVPGHLKELRDPLGIVDVAPGKLEEFTATAADFLTPVEGAEEVEFPINLDRESIRDQIGMSPSARHIHEDVLAARIEQLPSHMTVTAKGVLSRFSRATK